MSVCENIRKKNRKVCIGDMTDVITLQNRNIQAPEFDAIDFDEQFSNFDEPRWAMIKTVNGKTYFDGVSIAENITHFVYIYFDSSVTSQTWVQLLDGRRLDILHVENLDEQSEFLLLKCVDRGYVNASKA